MIYSDGVTEQFDLHGNMFGIDGLDRGIQADLTQPGQHARSTLESFRGSALIKDEGTLCLLDLQDC